MGCSYECRRLDALVNHMRDEHGILEQRSKSSANEEDRDATEACPSCGKLLKRRYLRRFHAKVCQAGEEHMHEHISSIQYVYTSSNVVFSQSCVSLRHLPEGRLRQQGHAAEPHQVRDASQASFSLLLCFK